MPPKKKTRTKTPKDVAAIRHQDTRKNIPTRELRDFVADDEAAPSQMLYPRDPSLDPQLVWKGKDKQDREDLSVPVVPIYIQEKIHPQALIEDLRRQQQQRSDGQAHEAVAAYGEQLQLFGDFNGFEESDFDARVDFYQHDHHWTNRMILGDSLMVMTSLAEKEGLKGQVQMIYVDPPYGIKFGSNWQVSTRKRDVKDGKVEDLTRQPEQIRAFRDTWELGIHSYLSYLRDRFTVARELLTETGSIFVQIGDENVHLVRCVLDEVFGAENFVSQITFKKTTGQTAQLIAGAVDYLLVYARQRNQMKYRQLFQFKEIGGAGGGEYQYLELPDGTTRRLTKLERAVPSEIPGEGRVLAQHPLTSQRPPGDFPVHFQGKKYVPRTGYWKTSRAGMANLIAAGRVVRAGSILKYKRYFDDFVAMPIANYWEDTSSGASSTDPKVYVVQTTTRVIERCMLLATDPGDLVLDPTCGSGSTALVAEQWGRRWITCDTSRVALALARTRVMSASFPYYYLADQYPQVGLRGTDSEVKSTVRKTAPNVPDREADIRKGFVYKRVPHITLKSIANNPDIQEGMSRQEIDEAIQRHADIELLVDQPYEDNNRVRVTGPFTVESLSPHRVLPADANLDGQLSDDEIAQQQDFVTIILDNLRTAGVQNTIQGERLKFDQLDPHPGQWIHAIGTYTDKDGKNRRVAISIGPEHGTVGPDQLKEAAKEAVQGLGHDLLLVCGFAFDPHVSEEAKRYGQLAVLPAKMNPDLAMGPDLLKKTGAGNLFMVFGEPDLEIHEQDDGQIQVELKGVDIYDPTTSEIRSNNTDDIACWFIDTNYDGESFFVRHAYFTGADEPYDKLKRALRAEIDEDAWAELYQTVSRPFPQPETGKIAVKVINHYGDEVLKVWTQS